MGDIRVGMLKTTNPALTEDAEFFPGLPKSWGLSFMINEEAAPRPVAACRTGALDPLQTLDVQVQPALRLQKGQHTPIVKSIIVRPYPGDRKQFDQFGARESITHRP
jgi:hypothetical protein